MFSSVVFSRNVHLYVQEFIIVLKLHICYSLQADKAYGHNCALRVRMQDFARAHTCPYTHTCTHPHKNRHTHTHVQENKGEMCTCKEICAMHAEATTASLLPRKKEPIRDEETGTSDGGKRPSENKLTFPNGKSGKMPSPSVINKNNNEYQRQRECGNASYMTPCDVVMLHRESKNTIFVVYWICGALKKPHLGNQDDGI